MNRIEITRLDTGETVSGEAQEPFSTPRLIVAKFNSAEALMSMLLKALRVRRKLLPRALKVAIQQTEDLEGGLSDMERRALRDLSEQVGGISVVIIEHNRPLSAEEALTTLK